MPKPIWNKEKQCWEGLPPTPRGPYKKKIRTAKSYRLDPVTGARSELESSTTSDDVRLRARLDAIDRECERRIAKSDAQFQRFLDEQAAKGVFYATDENGEFLRDENGRVIILPPDQTRVAAEIEAGVLIPAAEGEPAEIENLDTGVRYKRLINHNAQQEKYENGNPTPAGNN